VTAINVDHCHTCGAPYLPCGTPWPPSLHDVTPVRCALPRGHRSAEHWHAPLWRNTDSLVWVDDPEKAPDHAG
jgi:hypothetical protein